jgi:hypothetical protein
VTGHFAYFAVPTNIRALLAFRYYVIDIWRRTLRRRSQKDACTWHRIAQVYQDTGFPSLASSILGQMCASPSHTRERSPVPESGSLGAMRGASGNGHDVDTLFWS